MKYKNGWKKTKRIPRDKKDRKKIWYWPLGSHFTLKCWATVSKRWDFCCHFFRKLVQKGGAGVKKGRNDLIEGYFLRTKKIFRELTYWKGLARVEKFQCSKIWAWNLPENSKKLSKISLELSIAWIGPENFWKFPRKFRGEISTGNFLATLGLAWQILTCLVIFFFQWHNCL